MGKENVGEKAKELELLTKNFEETVGLAQKNHKLLSKEEKDNIANLRREIEAMGNIARAIDSKQTNPNDKKKFNSELENKTSKIQDFIRVNTPYQANKLR